MHHFVLDLSPIWMTSSLMMTIMSACVAGRCLQDLTCSITNVTSDNSVADATDLLNIFSAPSMSLLARDGWYKSLQVEFLQPTVESTFLSSLRLRQFCP